MSKLANALKNLHLVEPLSKDEAKKSLLCKPLRTVYDYSTRDRQILDQLLLGNPCALEIYTVPNNSADLSESKDTTNKQDRNTNDVITDIFIAAQEEVRDMIANVLINSARSVPLLLPTEKPELCLW
jgi:hypothetical protein